MTGFPFWDMGISVVGTEGLRFHDCLAHRDLGVFKESFSVSLPVHGSRVYRVSVVR